MIDRYIEDLPKSYPGYLTVLYNIRHSVQVIFHGSETTNSHIRRLCPDKSA